MLFGRANLLKYSIGWHSHLGRCTSAKNHVGTARYASVLYRKTCSNLKVAVHSTQLEAKLKFVRYVQIAHINNRFCSTHTVITDKNSIQKQVVDDEGLSSDEDSILEPGYKRESKHDWSGNREASILRKMFPNPKHTISNILHVVQQDLKSDKMGRLDTNIHLDREKLVWKCSAQVFWPKQYTCSDIGDSKKAAVNNACLQLLSWMLDEKKISEKGAPILVDREGIKALRNKALGTLTLGEHSRQHIDAIIDEYTKNFVPHVTEDLQKEMSTNNADDCYVKRFHGDNSHLYDGKTIKFPQERYFAVEKLELPVTNYKEEFISMLRENRVIVLKGETGCGKSTRIPQYIMEAWARDSYAELPCKIAITQPRRIAAISLAERVAAERNEPVGQIVGYQVRLRSQFDHDIGKLYYCTTGILLRILQMNPNLVGFTHVVLDEAHERDVSIDLLMNLLRTTMQRNPQLKLVIMSATIDAILFQRYFNDAPALHIPGFTHPVKAHYLEDIEVPCQRTREMCLVGDRKSRPQAEQQQQHYRAVNHEDVVSVIRHISKTKPDGAILCFLPGWNDISSVERLLPASPTYKVLCLHSRLQDDDQRLIFDQLSGGVRKIILATNIAETSVTINDVVYVIDTGIHKEGQFDNERGVRCVDNRWISKASMIQRRGRAGRCQPGESYHLYPRELADTFSEYSTPEILRASLVKIVLDAKVFSNNMDAVEFMKLLPCPPEVSAIQGAVRELKDLDLLDDDEKLTALGRTLTEFQLEPKLAKTLVNSMVYSCVTPITDIVTMFSAESEIFRTGLINKETVKATKCHYSRTSDHLAMMKLFEQWLELFQSDDNSQLLFKFCRQTNLSFYKMTTLEKLRTLHFDYLRDYLYSSIPMSDENSSDDELVKGVLLSGVGTMLVHYNFDVVQSRVKQKNVLITNNNHKAMLSPASVNSKRGAFPSDLLLYINETRSKATRITTIRETSLVTPYTAILMSPKQLETIDNNSDDGTVRLKLKDTKIEFECTREQAKCLVECKTALTSMYKYCIHHLVQGKNIPEEPMKTWKRSLVRLSRVLNQVQMK